MRTLTEKTRSKRENLMLKHVLNAVVRTLMEKTRSKRENPMLKHVVEGKESFS